MKPRIASPVFHVVILASLVVSACGAFAPEPTSTPLPSDTPAPPTATITLTPTDTPRPTPTHRPTQTPNITATQRIEQFNAETRKYFENGYLTTANGRFVEYGNFFEEWAQLNWYQWWVLDEEVRDFYLSARFKWSSAYRNADTSGCGFVFAVQDNGDHYAVFLDRAGILFLDSSQSSNYSRRMGTTRGTGRVNFGNPADESVRADFTLIVKGNYAYVLVDGEVVGEYTLSQSRILQGNVGLTLLSGTNRGFGTRCEMTNVRLWIPEE